MLNRDDNDFDDFLRKKMEELPSDFNASQWSRMENMISQSGHTRSAMLWQSIKAKLFIAAGVMTGSGALFFIGLNLKDLNQDKNGVIVSKQRSEQVKSPPALFERPTPSTEEQIAQASGSSSTTGHPSSTSLASVSSLAGAQHPLAGLSKQIIRQREEGWIEEAGLTHSASANSSPPRNPASDDSEPAVASVDANPAEDHVADASPVTESDLSLASNRADLIRAEAFQELSMLDALEAQQLPLLSALNAPLKRTAQKPDVGVSREAFEAAQELNPVVGSGKLMKQSLGFAAGFQASKAYNQTDCRFASGGFVELSHVLQVGKRIAIQSELGLNYREGLNYSKSSRVYIPGFGLEEYSYTVNNRGSMNLDLLSGLAFNLGKAGIVNIGTGPQIMLDTRSSIDKDLDTLLIPDGNWGYRAGYRKLDWMLRAGYQLPLCSHWEWIIHAGFGLRSDNTDNAYFGVLRNDRNLYLRSGLRYMIQGRKTQSIPERFSEK